MIMTDEESSEPEGGQGHQINHPQDINTNPLKNPVVLARLFEVCELSDLHRFRLVSKEWYSLSLPRCRREMKLTIYQKPHGLKPYQQVGRLQWTKIGDELEVVGNKPFQSVVIHGLEIRSEEQFHESKKSEQLKQLYNHFWDNYGQWITKLELVGADIYSTEALKKVIFVGTPNLQELKLTRPRIKKEAAPNKGEEREVVKVQPNLKCLSVNKMFQTTWQLFFRHFPNIQRLELSEIGSDYHVAPLVDTLEELTKNGSTSLVIKELILDKLNFEWLRGNGVQRLLQLPQVKLTSLHLDLLGCEGLDMGTLPMVLRMHGEMLKELRIIDCQNNPDSGPGPAYHRDMGPYSSFPFQSEPFLALTELHLEYAVNKNLHFLKQFPNLKIFRMIQYIGERMLTETNWERLANFKLIHLEEFKFFVKSHRNYWEDNNDTSRYYYIPEEMMERFVKLMPNVKYLSAQVKTPGLRVICQNWRELRKLELHDAKGLIDDEGLTGMKKGKEDEERLPNVADLRYLTQLSILGGRNMNIGKLSVNKVFLQLPFLHTLNLSLNCSVRDPTYRTLVKQFPNGNISRCLLRPADVYEDEESEVSDDEESDGYSSSDFEIYSEFDTDEESQSTDSDAP